MKPSRACAAICHVASDGKLSAAECIADVGDRRDRTLRGVECRRCQSAAIVDLLRRPHRGEVDRSPPAAQYLSPHRAAGCSVFAVRPATDTAFAARRAPVVRARCAVRPADCDRDQAARGGVDENVRCHVDFVALASVQVTGNEAGTRLERKVDNRGNACWTNIVVSSTFPNRSLMIIERACPLQSAATVAGGG
jgi:hypothetical protein